MRVITTRSLATVLSLGLLLTPTSHAEVLDEVHSIIYQEVPTEYCYNESFNLGICLERQRHELINYSQKELDLCTECTGDIEEGDFDACDELKSLNNVRNVNATEGMIDWDETFCVSYDRCVMENCPHQCEKEQTAWLECLILELNCDWRCPGSTWSSTESGMDMSSSSNVGWMNDESFGIAMTQNGMVLTSSSNESVRATDVRLWVAGLLLVVVVGLVIVGVVTRVLAVREELPSQDDALGVGGTDTGFT